MIGNFIPDETFERDSEYLLYQCKREFDWQDDFLPVDVDAILEFHFGLEPEWVDLTKLLQIENVVAAICQREKKVYMNIQYEKTFEKKPGFLNFSKGHELGHWVYHAKHDELCTSVLFGGTEKQTYLCRANVKNRIELQADKFSAALLMPREILRQKFFAVPEDRRYEWVTLYDLAKVFEVSISALVKRLQGLKWIYLEDKTIYRNESTAAGQLFLF